MHNTQMLVAGILHLLEESIQVCLVVIGHEQTGRILQAVFVKLLQLLRLQGSQSLFHYLLWREDSHSIRVGRLFGHSQRLCQRRESQCHIAHADASLGEGYAQQSQACQQTDDKKHYITGFHTILSLKNGAKLRNNIQN